MAQWIRVKEIREISSNVLAFLESLKDDPFTQALEAFELNK